jgi:hypothetical protein
MRNTRRAHILQREGLLHETLTRGHPSSIQSSHCATNMQWLCKLVATANPAHIKHSRRPPNCSMAQAAPVVRDTPPSPMLPPDPRIRG